ncbi:MAG: MBL fold metallo-hydrolase, partial [Dehalococcoidia bacterium]|nr:MBL fold metallo-hydrolase [Dehalococcoidia bacterium]
YADIAAQNDLRIKYILETHRNEDYVVGSLELAEMTGAAIFHGPGLPWKYGNTLAEGQAFGIGDLRLTAVRTPGHTDESMSYVLTDLSTGKSPIVVFTGDALFVGDVGRTDLYGPEEVERLATSLYDSIFNKILPLGDGVLLYAGHGGGSVCGANIADRDESSLGIERSQNHLLKMDREAFIEYKMAEKPERPHYFKQMEKYNLEGPPVLGGIPSPRPLSPAEFRSEIEKGALVIDASEPAAFGSAHIKGSLSIWLGGLPVFGGWVLPYDRPLLLVLEDRSHLDRAVRYLFRAGYDRIDGYLAGGIQGWYNSGFAIEKMPLLSVQELKAKLEQGGSIRVLDVRSREEWDRGHIKGSLNVHVGHLNERIKEIPTDVPLAVVCGVGHRSGLGASILLRAGFKNVHNVLGSMRAWNACKYPVSKG